MNIYLDEEWFVTRLAVVESSEPVLEAAVPHLQAELQRRDYWHTRDAAWDALAHRIIVRVEEYGYEAQSTAEGVAEEVAEIVAGVLSDAVRFHIDILDVHPVE